MFRHAVLVFFTALVSAGMARADAPIAGDWLCDYGVRKLSSAMKSSSAWFEVTFAENGRFRGTGKATAAGTSLPIVVRGAWRLDDGLLKLTGLSDVSNRVVPFRFVTKRIGDDRFKHREVKGASEYRTSCKR